MPIQANVVFLPVKKSQPYVNLMMSNLSNINKPTPDFAIGLQETSVPYALSMRFLYFSAN